MAIKDTIKHMRSLLECIQGDLGKAEAGNKAASQRVRTCTIKLEKVAKLYRKESVKAGKKGGAKRKPAARPTARKATAKKRPAAKKTVRRAPVKRGASKRKATSAKRATAKLPRARKR